MMPMGGLKAALVLFVFLYLVADVHSYIDSAHVEAAAYNLQEYCTMESFKPQCSHGEVVVIDNAIYGRRHAGKCIDVDEASLMKDPRYIGCSTDVRQRLDEQCSARKTCEVRIPDARLEQDSPCLKGLKMFLEASYSCVAVVEEDRSCVVLISSNPLHIAARPSSSSVSNTHHGIYCGTESQPWLLEAPAGQKISIKLLDFTPTNAAVAAGLTAADESTQHTSSLSKHDNCMRRRRYGYIVDKSAAAVNTKNVSICSGTGIHRISNIHMSSSSSVELVLTTDEEHAANGNSANFLVRVEAVGCTDLVPPEDAWIKRDNDRITIGCYTSRQTWQLRCEDGRWIGVVSNCSKMIPESSVLESANDLHRSEATFNQLTDNHQVVVTVAIGFVGLAICLTIICCGVVCLQRFYVQTTAAEGKQSAFSSKYGFLSPQLDASVTSEHLNNVIQTHRSDVQQYPAGRCIN